MCSAPNWTEQYEQQYQYHLPPAGGLGAEAAPPSHMHQGGRALDFAAAAPALPEWQGGAPAGYYEPHGYTASDRDKENQAASNSVKSLLGMLGGGGGDDGGGMLGMLGGGGGDSGDMLGGGGGMLGMLGGGTGMGGSDPAFAPSHLEQYPPLAMPPAPAATEPDMYEDPETGEMYVLNALQQAGSPTSLPPADAVDETASLNIKSFLGMLGVAPQFGEEGGGGGPEAAVPLALAPPAPTPGGDAMATLSLKALLGMGGFGAATAEAEEGPGVGMLDDTPFCGLVGGEGPIWTQDTAPVEKRYKWDFYFSEIDHSLRKQMWMDEIGPSFCHSLARHRVSEPGAAAVFPLRLRLRLCHSVVCCHTHDTRAP